MCLRHKRQINGQIGLCPGLSESGLVGWIGARGDIVSLSTQGITWGVRGFPPSRDHGARKGRAHVRDCCCCCVVAVVRGGEEGGALLAESIKRLLFGKGVEVAGPHPLYQQGLDVLIQCLDLGVKVC